MIPEYFSENHGPFEVRIWSYIEQFASATPLKLLRGKVHK